MAKSALKGKGLELILYDWSERPEDADYKEDFWVSVGKYPVNCVEDDGEIQRFNINKKLNKGSLLYVATAEDHEIIRLVEELYTNQRKAIDTKEVIPLIDWGFTLAGPAPCRHALLINYPKKHYTRKDSMFEYINDVLKTKGIKPVGLLLFNGNPIGHYLAREK